MLLFVIVKTSVAQSTWTPTAADPTYRWNNVSNWTGGIPTSASNVTIGFASGIVCTLDVNVTISRLTFSGNLNLNGYTLTINKNGVTNTFTGGTIANSGSVIITNNTSGGTTINGTTFGANVDINSGGTTTTTTSGGTTFNGTVSFQSPNIDVSSTTFKAVTTITKTGNVLNTWSGGNTFKTNATIINQGTGILSLGGNTTYDGSATITNSSIGTLYTHRTFNTTSNDNYNDNTVFQNSSSGTLAVSSEGTGQSIFSATNSSGTPNLVTITNNGSGTIEITQAAPAIFNSKVTINNNSTGSIHIGSGTGNPFVYFMLDTDIFNTSSGVLNIGYSTSSIVRFGYQIDNTTPSIGGIVRLRNVNDGPAYRIGYNGSIFFSTSSIVDIDNNGTGNMFIGTSGGSVVTFDGSSSGSLTGTAIDNNSTGTLDLGTASGAHIYFFRDADIFNNSSGSLNMGNSIGSVVRFGYLIDDTSNSAGGTMTLKNNGSGDYRIGNAGDIFFSSVANTAISNESSGNIPIALNYSTGGTSTVDFNGPTTIINTTTSSGNIFVSLVTGSNSASTSVSFNNTVTFQNAGLNYIFVGFKTTNTIGSSSVVCNGAANFIRTNGTIYVAYGDPTTATNISAIFNGNVIFSSNGAQGIRVAEQPATATVTFKGDITLASSYNPSASNSGVELASVSGNVIISGTTDQIIKHDNATHYKNYIKNLTVNKPSGFLTITSLNTSQPVLEITSSLILTSGIVRTNRATNYASLHLGPGVTASPGSSTAYFDGPLSKTFNNVQSFNFHLGSNASYRLFGTNSVNASGANITTFIAEYKKENLTITQPTWGGPLTWPASFYSISGCEYWLLDRTIGTASINSVKLTWKSDECTSVYIGNTSDLSELRVTKWNGTNWLDLGASSLTGDYNAGSITSLAGPITSFSPFTLASTLALSPLPIELSQFSVRLNQGNVMLDWETLTELNNNLFEIERSERGLDFIKIGVMPGSGTSNVMQTYSWVDQRPFPGRSYYRLRQVDFDGTSAYSKTISIINESTEKRFSVYPVPANDKILFLSVKDDVKVFDQMGNVVFTDDDVNEIDLTGFNPGIYCIRISSGESCLFIVN